MSPIDHGRRPTVVDPYAIREDRPADDNLAEFTTNWPLYKGRIVVLIGAGASIGARGGDVAAGPLPSAVILRNEIWRRLMRPEGESMEKFDPADLGSMSLDQASAFVAARVGRRHLVEYLTSRFGTKLPLWQHAALPHLEPTALFTTNYDLLIEQGWDTQKLKAGFQPLVSIFAENQESTPGRVSLYKPHGSVDHLFDPVGFGGPVITTIDYFKMLSQKRRLLERWLGAVRGVCVLLIGYSMSDMDIGSHLYQFRQQDNGNNWYAVFPRSDATVRKYWANQLRIQQIDRTFAEFVHDVDAEVGFLPAAWKYQRIAALRKKHLIQ